jgi:hypothetical protein
MAKSMGKKGTLCGPNTFQGGSLCEEIYSGAILETDMGKQIPENGLEVGLGSTYA